MSSDKTSAAAPAQSEGEQEQGYLTVSTQSKNIRKGTMLLTVLFGIGLLCIWLMVKKIPRQPQWPNRAPTKRRKSRWP